MGILFKNKPELYKNLVLELTHRSIDLGYDTIYQAVVWDWDIMSTKVVEYGSTLGWGDDGNGQAVIDANEAVLEAYAIYKHNNITSSINHRLSYETICPTTLGFTVKVVKGQLLSKGTIGCITKVQETQFGTMVWVDGQRTYAKNLEVIAVPINYHTSLGYKQYPKNLRTLFK